MFSLLCKFEVFTKRSWIYSKVAERCRFLEVTEKFNSSVLSLGTESDIFSLPTVYFRWVKCYRLKNISALYSVFFFVLYSLLLLLISCCLVCPTDNFAKSTSNSSADSIIGVRLSTHFLTSGDILLVWEEGITEHRFLLRLFHVLDFLTISDYYSSHHGIHIVIGSASTFQLYSHFICIIENVNLIAW